MKEGAWFMAKGISGLLEEDHFSLAILKTFQFLKIMNTASPLLAKIKAHGDSSTPAPSDTWARFCQRDYFSARYNGFSWTICNLFGWQTPTWHSFLQVEFRPQMAYPLPFFPDGSLVEPRLSWQRCVRKAPEKNTSTVVKNIKGCHTVGKEWSQSQMVPNRWEGQGGIAAILHCLYSIYPLYITTLTLLDLFQFYINEGNTRFRCS